MPRTSASASSSIRRGAQILRSPIPGSSTIPYTSRSMETSHPARVSRFRGTRERRVNKQDSMLDSETHRLESIVHVESPSDIPTPLPSIVLSDSELSSVCLSSPCHHSHHRDRKRYCGSHAYGGTIGSVSDAETSSPSLHIRAVSHQNVSSRSPSRMISAIMTTKPRPT